MSGKLILLIEDEPAVRFGVHDFLCSAGYEVEDAETVHVGYEKFVAHTPDAVLLDYLLPDGNALDLLPRLRALDASIPVIILTAHGSIELAVRAVKEGAEQFLLKPLELPALAVILGRTLENRRNRKKDRAQRVREERDAMDPFLGDSPAIRALKTEVQRVLAADSPILIHGETGTGKGVLARWIHRHGPRAEEPLLDLNCAGLSREFLETELFGHERGAFTGAVAAKQGLFEVADGGTVFLDEIGDVDPLVQPKLLNVLEEKRFRRMGDVRDRQVDIRLIAATHEDLGLLTREKRFRSDLYYRISTIPLLLPALRDRVGDIPVCARAILRICAAELGRGEVELLPQAIKAMQAYPWPGNLREMRNILERALLLADSRRLEARHLRFQTEAESANESELTLAELERRHIARVLAQEAGKVERAASRLGIPRSSLYEKLKKYGLTPSKS